jgi:hypothetical protein
MNTSLKNFCCWKYYLAITQANLIYHESFQLLLITAGSTNQHHKIQKGTEIILKS